MINEENNENSVNEENENQLQEQESTQVTYSQEEVDKMLNERDELNQKTFNDKFDKRWAKESRKREKEDAKKQELMNLLMEQTGKNNIDDLLDLTYETYNVERKPKEDAYIMEVVGKNDAKLILELEDEEIEEEAERLSNIQNRSIREETTFMELGKYLSEQKVKNKRKEELNNLGLSQENLLENEEFNKVLSKFRDDTPMSEIYDYYKSKQPKSKQPFREGSVSDNTQKSENEIKEFYTYEESLKFTREDFKKNPKLLKAIEHSMTKWGKKN